MLTDVELLDLIKKQQKFRTDIELAGYLKLKKSMISAIRTGVTSLGPLQRLKILDHIQFLKVSNWVERLSPEGLAKAIRSHVENNALAIALPATEKGEPPEADIQLLSLIKSFKQCEKDEQLAPLLGLKRNALSMIRTGKAKFGLLPRVKILRMLDPDIRLETFEEALQSSETLLQIAKEHIENVTAGGSNASPP
ncbi:MAG TPA: hypothetical protein VI457_09465 [Methylococcaceae bacterium]|nr:hypothetical protein [Methylococcaceae bacterium]